MAGTTSGIQEAATAWSGSSAVGGMHLSILSTTPHTYTQGSIYLGCQMVYSVLCFSVFLFFQIETSTIPLNLHNLHNFFNAKNVDFSNIQNDSLPKIVFE